jgi:two-component system LytT family sensor kinase
MDSDEIKIPSMIIQPYVENALKHGLLHKKGKKFLHLSFVKKENLLECVIDDNGIGRAASETIKKRNKKHFSFAIRATAERLKLMLDYYKLKIDLQVIDKYRNQVSAGTRVILKIPLN